MKKLTGGGRRRRCGILRVNCQTAAAAASGTVQISPSFCRCRERQKCYDLRAIHLDKTAILAPKRNLNFREGDFPGDIFVAPCVMFGCCSVAVRLPPSSPSGFWPDVHLFEARDGNCDFCPLSLPPPALPPLPLQHPRRPHPPHSLASSSPDGSRMGCCFSWEQSCPLAGISGSVGYRQT